MITHAIFMIRIHVRESLHTNLSDYSITGTNPSWPSFQSSSGPGTTSVSSKTGHLSMLEKAYTSIYPTIPSEALIHQDEDLSAGNML